VGQQRVEIPSLNEAVKQFLSDAEARNLRASSLKKYRRLLEGELLPFCVSRRISALDRITVETVRAFRDSLQHSPVTQQKKLEYLRAFFTFCQASDWVAKNPAKSVKLPRIARPQVAPFTADEMKRLLVACDQFRGDGTRLRAMILLLQSTGLRIADAVSLKRERVNEGRIFLYTSKTGTTVWCPIPTQVQQALNQLPGESYLFWSGRGQLKSALEDWRRSLVAVAKLADIEDAHFHRFRHTFSVRLLERGVPVETVATLLGNTPGIVAKHYSAFVQSRQQALEAAVRQTWTTSPA
jgi:site-specific recombinase XerD